MTVDVEKRLKFSHLAFVGSVGVPNRYGGFESFLEHCGPEISKEVAEVIVTCDASVYENQECNFKGVKRIFIPIRANGAASIFHDAFAFFRVFNRSSHIFFLGVSGGLWFPIFRLMCDLTGKKIIVNIDGVEWRRRKFGKFKRGILRLLDGMSQVFSHKIIYDNEGLRPYILKPFFSKSSLIDYPGDYVQKIPGVQMQKGHALTICRIEPENNLDILIEGALNSRLDSYTVVGNWNHSPYARNLREKYRGQPKIRFLDPIYDAMKLAELRQSCEIYLHGHSVGGTNPSLVEMLFYDCRILCFDVDFNRFTTDNELEYFKNSGDLVKIISTQKENISSRDNLRKRYSRNEIVRKYLALV
nr:DUF1972 domain-containing protein [Comamonas testosteroni]